MSTIKYSRYFSDPVLEWVGRSPRRGEWLYQIISLARQKRTMTRYGLAKHLKTNRKQVYRFFEELYNVDRDAYLEISKVVAIDATINDTNESQSQKGTEPNKGTPHDTSFVTFSDTPEGSLLRWVVEGKRDKNGKIIHPGVSRVQGMAEPLTEPQCRDLLDRFPKRVIFETLEQMHNHADLHKKYKSAYLTCVNWAKRRTTNRDTSGRGQLKSISHGQSFN